jgi:hypothetical protein
MASGFHSIRLIQPARRTASEEAVRRSVMDPRATSDGSASRVPPDEPDQFGESDQFGELRDGFIGWQCRLRQLAVRSDGGRPSPGMRPRVASDLATQNDAGDDDTTALDQLVVLIVEREPEQTTAHLRHLCRRTNDPRDRYDRVLSVLRAGYYQYPNRFSDAMTALFSPGSPRAASLLDLRQCVLHFEQFSQAYRIPCAVRSLASKDGAYQATFWHNAVFNPALPPDSEILAFEPDWSRARGWSWQTTPPRALRS